LSDCAKILYQPEKKLLYTIFSGRIHILPPGEYAYRCDKCGKGMNYTRGFKEHLKLHLPEESLCNNCGETFPTRFDLR
jgi:DNA-directed RNA polymerase subunit RPC12/RpoP